MSGRDMSDFRETKPKTMAVGRDTDEKATAV
jgi:hypothetical protein